MKKSIIIFLILFLPLISAVTIDIKTEFSQGETFIAKVSGNFYEPILKENILFYRGHVRIPMSPFITKINNDFYIYVQLDKPEDNYTLTLKNVQYNSGGSVLKEDISKNFTISNKTADFAIDPGFVIINGKFLIEVENLQDPEITIEAVTNSIKLESTESIILSAGQKKKIYFLTDDVQSPKFETIKLSSENTEYVIPVYIFLREETTETTETIGTPKDLEFDSSGLDFSFSTDSEIIRKISLSNKRNETIENIELTLDDSLIPYISLSIEEIDELEAGETIEIELTFFSDEEIYIEGELKAESLNFSDEVGISLNFEEDFIPVEVYEIPEGVTPSIETCEEMQGKICSANEECSTDYVYAKDDKCCLGICGTEAPSSSGKIIGWSLIGVIGIFLTWFFMKKYKGAKKPANILDIAKGKKR